MNIPEVLAWPQKTLTTAYFLIRCQAMLAVGLRMTLRLRRMSDQQHEDALRHGIQCPGMADTPDLQPAPQHLHHIVGRQAFWLVNDEESVSHHVPPLTMTGLAATDRVWRQDRRPAQYCDRSETQVLE